MTLDEIRRLNIRDAGNWPLLPKIVVLLAIFLAIILAGLFLDWKEQWEALGAAEQVEVGLKTQYTEKKNRAINFDLYVQQLSEVEQSFGALVKQLPNRSEIDALLTDVNQAGLGRGLQFELFKPAAKESMADFYAELPINIKITGSYHDMGAFASDIAQLPRIVTLNDVAISTDKGTLSMEAVAKTFRYLDEDEIAKNRAQAESQGQEMKYATAICLCGTLMLAGCGSSGHPDLDAWMKDQGKTAKGKLDPLPQIKPYDPFTYNAFDLPDPFKPRKIEPTKGGSKLAPDFTRRKEPLEAFPLESLVMVGTLARNKTHYALVRTPEKDVFQVKAGNYLGQNYGVIIEIGDGDLKLKELLQDGAGDWTERSSSLQLQQQPEQKR